MPLPSLSFLFQDAHTAWRRIAESVNGILQVIQNLSADPTTGALTVTAPIGQDGMLVEGNANGTIELTVQNKSAGALAYQAIALKNSTHGAAWVLTSNGYAGTYLTNGFAAESLNLYTAFATPFSIGVNNAAAINMDLSNRVTTPSQPAFMARRSASAQSIANAATTVLVFDAIDSHTGTDYASGTGLFTAPVTGVYMFCASTYIETGAGGTSVTPDVYFTKNASADGTAGATWELSVGPLNLAIPASSFLQFTGNVVIPLTAGDTLGVSCHTGSNAGGAMQLIQGTFSYFSGTLLG